MIVCSACNAQNEDDATFCGNCGEYLEWVGEKVAEAPEVVYVEPEPEEKSGIVERVKSAVGIGDSDDKPAPPTASATGVATAPPPPPVADDGGMTTTATPTTSSEPEEDPFLTEPPPAPPAPPATTPVAVAPPTTPPEEKPAPAFGARKPAQEADLGMTAKKPQAEKAAPKVQKRKSTLTTAKEGDLICGNCGEPNDPERKFCKRCANKLAGAQVVKIPWWRRIFRRRQKVVPAGGRVGATPNGDVAAGGQVQTKKKKRTGRSVGGMLRMLLGFALIILLVLAFVAPDLRKAVREKTSSFFRSIRCLVQNCDAVVPLEGAIASSFTGKHDALSAVDGGLNTYWSAGNTSGTGTGEWLCINFDQRVDLSNIGFYLGARDKTGAFKRAEPRPREVNLVYLKKRCSSGLSSTPPARANDETVTLKDGEAEVFHKPDADGVRAVQIIVTRVFPGQKGDNVSLAEVEFFTRQ